MSTPETTESVDVAAIVADIQATVETKRVRGEYPQELLDALHAEFSIEASTDPPEVLSLIQSARPVRSSMPVVGAFVVLGKKVVRRMLAWYVQPIAQDQTRFNNAITRELRGVERRLRAVEPLWAPPGAIRAPQAGARAQAIQKLIPTHGPLLLIGADSGLTAALPSGRDVQVFDANSANHAARLTRLPGSSFGAVVLSGVLQRISAREILDVIQAAARLVGESGSLLIEGPDPNESPRSLEIADIDATMVRWLSVDTVSLLAESAGLSEITHVAIDGSPRWFVVAARRP